MIKLVAYQPHCHLAEAHPNYKINAEKSSVTIISAINFHFYFVLELIFLSYFLNFSAFWGIKSIRWLRYN